MRLPLCSWYDPLEEPITASRDRIGVTERSQKRLFPASQRFPRLAVRHIRRITRRSRYQQWKLASSRLITIVRERRIISRDHLGGKFTDTPTLNNPTNVESGRSLRVSLPGEKCLTQRHIARRQAGIRCHNTSKTLPVLSHQPQSNQSTPVLAHQRNMPQIKSLKHTSHPIDMPLVCIIFSPGWLVRSTKANQVRRNSPVASSS